MSADWNKKKWNKRMDTEAAEGAAEHVRRLLRSPSETSIIFNMI